MRTRASGERHVGVEQHPDVPVASLHGHGERGQPVVVGGVDVDVGMLHQHLDDLKVAMFSRTHQRGRAVLVPDVQVGPCIRQQLHHVQTTMAHCQHEGGLPVLRGPQIQVRDGEELLDDRPVTVVGDDCQGDEHAARVAGLVQDVGVGHLKVEED